jgi:hypothetical protein
MTTKVIDTTNLPIVIDRIKTYTDYSMSQASASVAQTQSTANEELPLLMAGESTPSANYIGSVKYVDSGVSVNPSTKTVTATNFVGSLQGTAALSGVPTAPTATLGTNTTQIATTAFVRNEIQNDMGSDNTDFALLFNNTVEGPSN